MDYAQRARQGEGQMAPQHMPSATNKKDKKGGMNLFRIVFSLLIISVAILSLALLVFVVFGGGKSESDLIKKDKYQAVFLNDQSGQVYFGRLSVVNAQYYKLTDIYYVRVDSAVQPDKSGQTQQNISLAKLGNELHGPEDEMFVARDEVLFWENLKDDGQVVKAITEYKKNGGQTNNNTNSNNNASSNNTSTNNAAANNSSNR